MTTFDSMLGMISIHWPFLAFAVVISILAQVLKTRVLTKEYAKKVRSVFWLRRLMPILLLGAGFITGAVWPGEPSPGVSEVMHKILYFVASACVSITAFSSFKNWVKKKYDLDIGLKG
jgi:hypothetical protein